MTIKVENYNILKTESPENEIIEKIRNSEQNRNDFIDTCLLKEIYR
jgi:hypothetical protein